MSSFFGNGPYHATPALYVYDFGDDWEHLLVYEGLKSAEHPLKYPRGVSGVRGCPPEDCGGVHGYAEFLVTFADPTHPEHASTLTWVGGHYDPDAVDPHAVVFENPRKRWKIAFER